MSLLAFQRSIQKILEDYFKYSLYSDVLQKDSKKETKFIRFYSEIMKSLILNRDQLAVTLYLVDRFLDCQNRLEIVKSYTKINNLFEVAISTTHKLTQDFCYNDICLRKLFKNEDLTKLENKCYELIEYNFELNNPIIKEYTEFFLFKYL